MGTVKNAIKLLNGTVKQADEVLNSAVKNSNNSLIKAGVNLLESNSSNAQRIVKNTGTLSTTVRRGSDAASDIIDNRTVNRALNNNVPEVIPNRSMATGRTSEPIIIGQGNSTGNKFDEWAQNAIDLEPNSNRRTTRKSTRRGNRTQQPETPKVIYSGQGDNPKVIYADGPTADTGGGGNNNGGGGNKTTTGTGGPESNNNNRKQQQAKTKRTFDSTKQEALDNVTGFAKEMFGGVTDTYRGFRDGQGIVDSFVNAHKNADGSINKLRAAGTFMTASTAARVASGGGLYKDRYGNPNLIGVPFI